MSGPAHPQAAAGPVVGSSRIGVDAVLGCLGQERAPLAVAAGSQRGWFGGLTLVAWDPVGIAEGLDVATAAGLLENAFNSDRPVLAAALLLYEGASTIACYEGGLVLSDDGWRPWGRAPADLAGILQAATTGVAGADASLPLLQNPGFDTTADQYRTAVEAAREAIADGDVYVLNLTARVAGKTALPPGRAFAALGERTHADMAAFFDGWSGDVPWLASASPERFVRIRRSADAQRLVEICPIKGTAPRGNTPEADAANKAALLGDEKERAEHVMVVDMERNDIGTVCVPGSVRVEPLYEIVSTPYCHQMVSTVRGTLRPAASFAQTLAAVFPCGSVTGAPKVAAMRMIDRLERSPRGAYCGSLVVAVPGELDSSVIIRSLEGTAEPSRAIWGTGCGITYESDAASEWLEVLLKASPALGDGRPPIALRETMRLVAGRPPLLERHLARLASGGCGPRVLQTVREKVAENLAPFGDDPRTLRLSVTVTPDGRVEAGVSDAASTLSATGGIRYALVEIDRLPNLPPSAAKPAARRYWDLAHRKATNRGAHQAVLATAEGALVDGSTANIWLVREGRLLTPLSPPAIAGVARGLVFDLASELAVSAAESELTTADLETADEVFFSNAHGGVALSAERGGPVGTAIAEAFEKVMAGGR